MLYEIQMYDDYAFFSPPASTERALARGWTSLINVVTRSPLFAFNASCASVRVQPTCETYAQSA